MVAIIFSLFLSATEVWANSAPNAPIPIILTIKNASEKPYYVSFVANMPEPSEGNYFYPEQEEITEEQEKIGEIMREKFQETGYYFWGIAQDCSANDTFEWKYAMPETVKILLYFPESDTFLVSQAVTLEQSENVYIINLEKQQQGIVQVKQISTVGHELLTLLMRMVFTILLELLLAFCMGFRGKNVFLFLLVTNLITQFFLNISLRAIWYFRSSIFPLGATLFLEDCIMAIEIFAYEKILPKWKKPTDQVKDVVPYVIIANMASFLSGIILASTFTSWANDILTSLI